MGRCPPPSSASSSPRSLSETAPERPFSSAQTCWTVGQEKKKCLFFEVSATPSFRCPSVYPRLFLIKGVPHLKKPEQISGRSISCMQHGDVRGPSRTRSRRRSFLSSSSGSSSTSVSPRRQGSGRIRRGTRQPSPPLFKRQNILKPAAQDTKGLTTPTETPPLSSAASTFTTGSTVNICFVLFWVFFPPQ